MGIDSFIDLEIRPIVSFQQRAPTADIQRRLNDLRPATAQLPRIMRFGDGSVEDQQSKGMTIGRIGRTVKWPPTKPFGNQKPGPAPLVRSGAYLEGWLGGPGGFTETSGTGAAIGLNPGRFPQAAVFQKDVPTHIRVTPKMRIYLGLNKGVWLKKSTTSITVEPRAFSVNPTMTRRARQVLLNYVVNGTPNEYTPGSFTNAA